MSDDLDPAQPSGRRPFLRTALGLTVAIALGALLAWWLHPTAHPTPSQSTAAPAPTATVEAPVAPPAPASPKARPHEPTAEPAPAEPAPAPAPAPMPTLRVASDVDGAFVFVDRKFVGKTPLETTDVTAGHHQLKVSAEGYDGVEQGVEIAESGDTDVQVSLKTVRLNASVDVVHKHTFGSCEGRLIATVDGLRYETSNKDDGFSLRLDQLEVFNLDYVGKNLRVKQRGGRTWNFTTTAANADPLLVFSREVDKARTRLAKKP